MEAQDGPFPEKSDLPRKPEVIPTGSLKLDMALKDGGIACGQFVEVSGLEGSGKTTLCQHIIAEAQKRGDVCALIDTDHTFNPAFARQCGVHLEHLYLSEPEHAEQALDVLEMLAQSGSMKVIVLDSLNTLIQQDELKTALGDDYTGTSDRLVSLALRKLDRVIRKTGATIIFTNRATERLSEVYHGLSLNLERLELKLRAGLLIKLMIKQSISERGNVIGINIEARIIKNKFLPCSDTIRFDIIYNEGINKIGEIIDLGTQLKVISVRERTYHYKDLILGKDRKTVAGFLSQNTPLAEEIERVIRQQLFSPV